MISDLSFVDSGEECVIVDYLLQLLQLSLVLIY